VKQSNWKSGIIRLVVFMAAVSAWAADPPVSFQTSLSTNIMHVGDRVTLTVSTAHNVNQRIALEPIQREPFIAVWDVQSKTKDISADEKSTTHTVTFSSFVIGQHRVSTNHLIVMGSDGSEEFIPLPELLINVVSVLSNPPPELSDIKPAVSIPGQAWFRLLWILLLVILIALLSAWLIRMWLKKPKASAAVKVIPPHEIALTALQALLSRGYIENKDAQPFYIELSAIVRMYLEDRFDLHASEQTTEEFIRTSSNSAVLSPDHRILTQAFLEQSDLVKFARFEPSSEDMRSAWDAAARLVRETIPSPVKPAGGTP